MNIFPQEHEQELVTIAVTLVLDEHRQKKEEE
jgi:hypothetical protein